MIKPSNQREVDEIIGFQNTYHIKTAANQAFPYFNVITLIPYVKQNLSNAQLISETYFR